MTTTIFITTHAEQRFSERMSFVPTRAREAVARRAFESPNNSHGNGAMSAFLRYYAKKYDKTEHYMVTEYNGYLFIFHEKKRTLITVIDDHEQKAYKAYLKYNMFNR